MIGQTVSHCRILENSVEEAWGLTTRPKIPASSVRLLCYDLGLQGGRYPEGEEA
jgi:hypothetical protein